MTKLEEAERNLRALAKNGFSYDQAIADELDRLRAELAEFKGEASRTVYLPAIEHDGGPTGAISRAMNGWSWPSADDADVYNEGAWAVRISATRVKP